MSAKLLILLMYACVHAYVRACVYVYDLSCSWDLATLKQQRRAVLVEMTVRQQHIDDQNENRRECETTVGPGRTSSSAITLHRVVCSVHSALLKLLLAVTHIAYSV